MSRIQISKILLRKEIIDRSEWVRYLGLPEWHVKHVGDIIERVPDEAFGDFVDKNVRMYMDGELPPEAILPAVMNITDDLVAGREPVLRAGDYIALQTAFRRK